MTTLVSGSVTSLARDEGGRGLLLLTAFKVWSGQPAPKVRLDFHMPINTIVERRTQGSERNTHCNHGHKRDSMYLLVSEIDIDRLTVILSS